MTEFSNSKLHHQKRTLLTLFALALFIIPISIWAVSQETRTRFRAQEPVTPPTTPPISSPYYPYADADYDNNIDQIDINSFAKFLNTRYCTHVLDLNRDCMVDILDFNIALTQIGQSFSQENKPQCILSNIPPANGQAPLTVGLHGGGTYPDGIMGYQWDFEGDGFWNTQLKPNPLNHTYTKPGTYRPIYRVLNNHDQLSNDCHYRYQITVSAPTTPLPTPTPEANLNPVSWQTDAVKLSAADFYFVQNNTKYNLADATDLYVDSPHDQSQIWLFVGWTKNSERFGFSMLIYRIYNTWYANTLSAYGPNSQINSQGSFFNQPIGTAYFGDVTSYGNVHTGDPYPGFIYFKNLHLETSF